MTKPILESVAKVLVVNEKQQVLILTIGEYIGHPEKSFTPDLPGGMVDPGETELIAVQRELVEETGIDVDASLFELAYAKTEYFAVKNKSVSKFLYILKLADTPSVRISWEHADYAWVPIEGLLENVLFRPFYEEAVRYAIAHRLV
jgi:8-oxo-dGTP pyrophosphatase MutT (NUDIX family)